MSRKNIFDLLQSRFDFAAEINRIETLFEDKILKDRFQYSAEEYVDENYFYSWKNRNRCLNCQDMRNTLGIPRILHEDEPTTEQVLRYIEYVENILSLCDALVSEGDNAEYYSDRDVLDENIKALLDHINHEAQFFEEKEMVLLIEKNEAATAAAELVDDETALSIFKYNHYSLKGEIEEKRRILLTIADKVEPLYKELRTINGSLESVAGFLLNNLNIRHNNKDKKGKNYKKIVDEMDCSELENWYDETYQVLLLCILEHDHIERNDKIKELRSRMGM